jgi:hypothetical protein
MAQAAKKAVPVGVGTAVEDVAKFYDLKVAISAAEKEQKSLKQRVLATVPNGQDSESFPSARDGKQGQYVVVRVSQDRRTINDEKLTALLESRGLFTRATKVVPDHDKVAKLIEIGALNEEDLATCLEGSQPVYPLVTWEAKKK